MFEEIIHSFSLRLRSAESVRQRRLSSFLSRAMKWKNGGGERSGAAYLESIRRGGK